MDLLGDITIPQMAKVPLHWLATLKVDDRMRKVSSPSFPFMVWLWLPQSHLHCTFNILAHAQTWTVHFLVDTTDRKTLGFYGLSVHLMTVDNSAILPYNQESIS